jgi:hypothetical protein
MLEGGSERAQEEREFWGRSGREMLRRMRAT